MCLLINSNCNVSEEYIDTSLDRLLPAVTFLLNIRSEYQLASPVKLCYLQYPEHSSQDAFEVEFVNVAPPPDSTRLAW